VATPSSVAQALNAAAPSLAYNRLRLDALGSLEADSNGVTTNGGGNFLNNSGSTRSVGDVVIYDTTTNDTFNTTTTVGDTRVLGVVIDGSIANAVRGAIQTRGPVLVNVSNAVARGDYLTTSGTAGQAQSNGGRIIPGTFAVALEASSGGTCIVLMFPSLLVPNMEVRAYNSAAISLASGASTALTLNSERYKTDATMHSTASNTSRLVAPVAGKYRVTAHAEIAAAAGGTIRQLSIRLNGGTTIAVQTSPFNGTSASELTVSCTYIFAANDYVEMLALQDSGGAINVNSAGNYSPEFEMEYVGP